MSYGLHYSPLSYFTSPSNNMSVGIYVPCNMLWVWLYTACMTCCILVRNDNIGIAPAELLMGRQLRTHLDLLYPTVKDKVLKNQRSSTPRGSRRARKCQYSPGDHVMCRNFMSGPTWMPGIVLEVDDTSLQVRLDDGRVWRRHMDHVASYQLPDPTSDLRQQKPVELPTEEDPLMAPASVTTSSNTPIEQSNDPVVEENKPPSCNSDTVELRRSSQAHQPPDWLM